MAGVRDLKRWTGTADDRPAAERDAYRDAMQHTTPTRKWKWSKTINHHAAPRGKITAHERSDFTNV